MANANYVISWHDTVNHGGSKAKQDVESFLKADGYHEIDTPTNNFSKVLYVYLKFPRIIKQIHNSTILFQFPSGKPFLRKKMMESVRNSDNRLIVLIHDIESLRLNHEPGREKTNAAELEQLRKCDGIISHNEEMTKWLRSQGVSVPIVNLGIFDYDNPQKINTSCQYDGSICFAGNLEKSSFLTKLHLVHPLILFGSHPADSYHPNLKYRGMFPPELLPQELTQNFGLVWDGPDTNSCTGPYGEYMKYNDPHKVSLYLSSGVPVIIWRQAALAKFVKDNHLGILTDDLSKLDEQLDRLSPAEYAQMKENVVNMSNLLRRGHYIKQAMQAITEKVMVVEEHE
jgi:hypothetical protein